MPEEYWIQGLLWCTSKSAFWPNTGEKGAGYSTRVIWKHGGCQYCNDLTGFVYN